MRHKKPLSLITVFSAVILMLFLVSNVTSCSCKDTQDETTNTATTQDVHPPDCPPVKIIEAYKLELTKTQYETLKTSAGPGAATSIVFQFAYKNAATRKLTLIAYASRPGRRYWDPSNPGAHPLTSQYLIPITTAPIPAPLALPNDFSLGDQQVSINDPHDGIDQLIASSPVGQDYIALTFTPALSIQGTITNIKYHICVKYSDPAHPGQFLEFCGAAGVDTQPSPPANAN